MKKVLRDLQVRDLDGSHIWSGPSGAEKKTQGLKFLKYLLKLFRFFTPFKWLIPAEGKKEYHLMDWHYCFQIGVLKDPIKDNGLDKTKTREVL